MSNETQLQTEGLPNTETQAQPENNLNPTTPPRPEAPMDTPLPARVRPTTLAGEIEMLAEDFPHTANFLRRLERIASKWHPQEK